MRRLIPILILAGLFPGFGCNRKIPAELTIAMHRAPEPNFDGLYCPPGADTYIHVLKSDIFWTKYVAPNLVDPHALLPNLSEWKKRHFDITIGKTWQDTNRIVLAQLDVSLSDLPNLQVTNILNAITKGLDDFRKSTRSPSRLKTLVSLAEKIRATEIELAKIDSADDRAVRLRRDLANLRQEAADVEDNMRYPAIQSSRIGSKTE